MTYCVDCEVSPVVHFNGEGLCAVHAEQRADLSARETPIIAYTHHVPFTSLQKGASTSGTPRHYK